MSIPAATPTDTVLADYALLRTSLVPKVLLTLGDGSGTTAVDLSASPSNGTYVGSPDLTNETPAYGNPDGTTGMELTQGGSAICRVPVSPNLTHICDGSVSHTTLIVFRSTDAVNPNPFNYPIALGFANDFGTYDHMVQMCLNGKADGNPNGGFACYRWYTAANGSIACEFNHGGSIFDGEVHTAAFVYSTAAGGTLKIYIDGVAGGTVTGVDAKKPTARTYFGIGTMVANNGSTLDRNTANVTFSDFQFFETELTASQIAGWHRRAINGEVSRLNTKRRVPALHAIDSSYGYAGGSAENAVITSGTLLATPVLSLHANDNSANDPTYGLTFNTNAATMGTNVANALIAAYDAGKPCILSFNKLLCQSCTMNAVSQGFSSQPTPTSLLTGLKARKFITTDEAARIAPWAVAYLARLSVTSNSALRFTAGWSNTEELPLADLAYNQPPGTYRDDLIAFRTAALADATIAARITGLIADGAPDDESALDYLIHEAAIAAARELLDTTLGSIPLAFYFMGKNAVTLYQFRNSDGTPNNAGLAVASLEIGSWAYQNNPTAGETALLIEDLSLKGDVPTIPLLDIRYAGDAGDKAELEARLNACRDRGINDVVIFGNQMADGAGTDLTNASAILAAAQGARMSIPVLQEASRQFFGGAIGLRYDVAVGYNGADPFDLCYKYDGNPWRGTDVIPFAGDNTTSPSWVIEDAIGNNPATVNDTISIAAGWVKAVSGGQDSDAVANSPCPIFGIVSATLDLSVTPPLVTMVYAESASIPDDYNSCRWYGNTGIEYAVNTVVSGSGGDTTHVMEMNATGGAPGTPSTYSLEASKIIRVSDSAPNIAVSGQTLTVIPAPSTGSLFRERLPRAPLDFRARR